MRSSTEAKIEPHSDEQERVRVMEFCRDRWQAGCLIGDLSREDPENLTDDEVCMLICAR